MSEIINENGSQNKKVSSRDGFIVLIGIFLGLFGPEISTYITPHLDEEFVTHEELEDILENLPNKKEIAVERQKQTNQSFIELYNTFLKNPIERNQDELDRLEKRLKSLESNNGSIQTQS